MQTAVNWLEQEFIKLEATIGVHGKMYELIDQAKQMETEQQQKMVDDALTNYELGWADRKASSQTEISDNMKTAVQQMIDFINDINDNDRSEFNYYYDHIMEKLNELLEVEKQQMCSQVEISDGRTKIHWKTSLVTYTPEISDEEIEEASKQINYGGGSMGWIKDAFKKGAKWYREQLNSKGNG